MKTLENNVFNFMIGSTFKNLFQGFFLENSHTDVLIYKTWNPGALFFIIKHIKGTVYENAKIIFFSYTFNVSQDALPVAI